MFGYKQLYIAVQFDIGSGIDGPGSYWTLDTVNQGGLGTVMV